MLFVAVVNRDRLEKCLVYGTVQSVAFQDLGGTQSCHLLPHGTLGHPREGPRQLSQEVPLGLWHNLPAMMQCTLLSAIHHCTFGTCNTFTGG